MRTMNGGAILLALCATLLFGAACGSPQETGDEIPITTTSDEARELFVQARDAMERGYGEKARDMIDKAIALDSAFAFGHFYRALLSDNVDEFMESRKAAERFAANASEGEQLMISMMDDWMSDNREGQLEKSRQLVAAYPRSARAQLSLARDLRALEMYDSCRAALLAAIALDGKLMPAYETLSNTYLFDEPKDLAKAEDYARQLIELLPDEPQPRILLGDVYRAQDDLQKAQDAYARAVERDRKHAAAWMKKAQANVFLGNYEQARKDFAAAMPLAEGNMKNTAGNYIVSTYVFAGDLDAALAANQEHLDRLPALYDDAETLEQAKMNTYAQRMMIAMHAGRFDVALIAYGEAARVARMMLDKIANEELSTTVTAGLLVEEGLLACEMGEYENARTLAARAGTMVEPLSNPRKNEQVEFLQGMIALREGAFAEALAHFEKAKPDGMYEKFYKAEALEGLGKTEEAMEIYREIADYRFNDPGFALIRAEAMQKAAADE